MNHRATLLIVLAMIVFTAGSAMAPARDNAPRITAGSAASGGLKPEVWKTACAATATS